jgi:hypothetical protein
MPHTLSPGWTYLDDSVDGGPFVIDGVDVWKHKWIAVQEEPTVTIVRGGDHIRLWVYDVVANGTKVRFAAGEFVMCGWAFCRPSVA